MIILSIYLSSCSSNIKSQQTIKPHSNKSKYYVWIDASSNMGLLSSEAGIKKIIKTCCENGMDGIILDVKPLLGEVLYSSKVAPRLKEWKGIRIDENLDILKVMVEAGHQAGLKVMASGNVLAEGHGIYKKGPVYSSHPDWASWIYHTKNGKPELKKITESGPKYLAALCNPLNPEVEEYEGIIFSELASQYPLDGIILDRLRYQGLEADFSELSKKEFQSFLKGKKVKFPDDIFTYQKDTAGNYQRKNGKYYSQWILWRATVIHEFTRKLVADIKKANPKMPVGSYVGSWYETYYEYGVNWASTTYRNDAPWAIKGYSDTGTGEIFDFMAPGFFYFKGQDNTNMERAYANATTVVGDDLKVYPVLMVEDYQKNPEIYKKVIKFADAQSSVIIFFDYAGIDKVNGWPLIKQSIGK
jgi:uncharacterized lipoprotein YddW (UPF0748 family)